MSLKPVLVPTDSHPITVAPADGRVRISFNGRVIADTDRALVLKEADYPAVAYIPLDEVDATVLRPSSHQTYCPYKGDASYYSLHDVDHVAADAVWSYAQPYDAVAPIAGHVAFYPQHVTIERLSA